MSVQITAADFDKARCYLLTHGRPLEQALFRVEFERGTTGDVLEALATFQNDDGGYGRSLEPDSVLNLSSVLDTTIALQIHRRIRTPADHPQVRAAIRYLLDSYWPSRGIWPIRSESSPTSPGGPWWQAETLDALIEAFGGCRFNPTAEVVGHLHAYCADVPRDRLSDMTQRVIGHCETHLAQATMHDLRCLRNFLESPALTDRPCLQRQLLEEVNTMQSRSIERDPSQWVGYCDRPFESIDRPDHPLVALLGEQVMERALAYQIRTQNQDGSWPTFWDWGGQFPELWKVSRRAWLSILTERALRVLRRFGRIEGGFVDADS